MKHIKLDKYVGPALAVVALIVNLLVSAGVWYGLMTSETRPSGSIVVAATLWLLINVLLTLVALTLVALLSEDD